MKITRILCPIDFSEFNEAANEYASTLAQSTGARIVYLHVTQPEVAWGANAYADIDQETKQDLRQLEKVKPTVEGVEATYVVERGLPFDRIVEYASENNIDLIVMGTHGRTGIRRVLMGSVAESVVRRSECPVLAIKSRSEVAQTN